MRRSLAILVSLAASACESTKPFDPEGDRGPRNASEVKAVLRTYLEKGFSFDHRPECPVEYVDFMGRFCRTWRILPDLSERLDLPVETCHILWILRSHTRCTFQMSSRAEDRDD
jgi:hypothetical protein